MVVVARAVFRGDLHRSDLSGLDAWNPTADWVSIRIFLALCARYGIFPSQIDLIMAFLQSDLRGERIFAKLPSDWAQFLPDDLKEYCGVPLLMIKAMYGYFRSGRLLYEDQAEFHESQGLIACRNAPALWYRHLENGGILLVTHFIDDYLIACTDTKVHQEFITAFQRRFDAEAQPRADWFLQARITRDAEKNITIDQSRYARAIVERYIPNAPASPSEEDLIKYSSPLPYEQKWTVEDNSKSEKELKELESTYGFRMIELAGSFNYLANTSYAMLFSIRKLCRFTRSPGPTHFKAALHMLHHIRCYPPMPLIYYHKVENSPLADMLRDAGHESVSPFFVWFVDSSFSDCDQQRSTGAYVGLLQGGIADMQSYVPSPIAMSSCQAEINSLTVATMASRHVTMIVMEVMQGASDHPFTMPMFIDSSSAQIVASTDRITRKSRHIERRDLYCREAENCGYIRTIHIKNNFMLADPGTKNLTTQEMIHLRKIVEAPRLP